MKKPHIKLKVTAYETEGVRWLNVYPTTSPQQYHAGGMYRTKARADWIAKPWRLACVPVNLGKYLCPNGG